MQTVYRPTKINAEYTAHHCRERGMVNVSVSRTNRTDRELSPLAYKVTFETTGSVTCQTCGDNPAVECSTCGSNVAGGLFGAGTVQQTLTLF